MRNVVKELRLTRGLSQASLGDALGVSRQTVNSIETGAIPALAAVGYHPGSFLRQDRGRGVRCQRVTRKCR